MKSLFILTLLSTIALAAEWLVGVGKDERTGQKGIGFDPSVIYPATGDDIAFEYRSGAHSVLQSTFEQPCSYNGGFNSGVFAVDESQSVDAPGLPVVRVRLNNTDPLWFFDHAGGLCQQGAVLAVNPTATQTSAQFRENAANDPGIPYNPPITSSSSTTAPESTPSNNTTNVDSDNSSVGNLPDRIGAITALYVVAALL